VTKRIILSLAAVLLFGCEPNEPELREERKPIRVLRHEREVSQEALGYVWRKTEDVRDVTRYVVRDKGVTGRPYLVYIDPRDGEREVASDSTTSIRYTWEFEGEGTE
jgi:hypothetical protein